MHAEGQLPADPPQPERTCGVPGCSNVATESRERLVHEVSVGRPRLVRFDLCDEHAAEFDADPDAFVRRMAGA